MDFTKMMQQMQQVQQKIAAMQEEMANKTFEGIAGGGMVAVVLNGRMEMVSIKIDPSVGSDTEMMEDLVKTAYKMAKEKLDQESSSNMSSMMGGMKLPPGFKMPF